MANNIETVERLLSTIPIDGPRIIIVKDKSKIYYDSSDGKRILISDVINVDGEIEIKSMTSPIEGKLYVDTANYELYTYANKKFVKLNNSSGGSGGLTETQVKQIVANALTESEITTSEINELINDLWS